MGLYEQCTVWQFNPGIKCYWLFTSSKSVLHAEKQMLEYLQRSRYWLRLLLVNGDALMEIWDLLNCHLCEGWLIQLKCIMLSIGYILICYLIYIIVLFIYFLHFSSSSTLLSFWWCVCGGGRGVIANCFDIWTLYS